MAITTVWSLTNTALTGIWSSCPNKVSVQTNLCVFSSLFSSSFLVCQWFGNFNVSLTYLLIHSPVCFPLLHVHLFGRAASFATIASVTLILIAILLVIVLLTVIVILLGKHRRLVKAQALQKEQQQLSENQLKNAYLDDSDNLNLYSTTASTRTNSSSDKEKQRCDGSPRSSSSSFVPYLHDDAEVLNGLGNPGLVLDHYGHHMGGPHQHQQSLSPAGYHFHTVYSPDSPSPFYNPYSINESPYHFFPNHQPVNAYHSHRNHFPSHVSMVSSPSIYFLVFFSL